MLSEKKIRMMIRLSDYELNQGKKDISRTGYFKSDYIRLQILKTIASVTVASLLVISLIALYNLEYIISNALKLDYVNIGTFVLIMYLLLVGLFSAITVSIESIRYEDSKKRVKAYYHTLTELMEYYDQEEQQEVEIL